MAGKPLNDLGELQRSIMELLWERGEATVQQVRDELSDDRDYAYTSILSAMQKLEKANWLTHRAEGKTYLYRPVRTREQEERNTVRRFRDNVFGGKALPIFQRLLEDEGLTGDELEAMRRLIAQRRRELRDG